MSEPVCSVCNDTHCMDLDGRKVMCTHCPVPCEKCRVGGNGAFCETTPCECECHGTQTCARLRATVADLEARLVEMRASRNQYCELLEASKTLLWQAERERDEARGFLQARDEEAGRDVGKLVAVLDKLARMQTELLELRARRAIEGWLLSHSGHHLMGYNPHDFKTPMLVIAHVIGVSAEVLCQAYTYEALADALGLDWRGP